MAAHKPYPKPSTRTPICKQASALYPCYFSPSPRRVHLPFRPLLHTFQAAVSEQTGCSASFSSALMYFKHQLLSPGGMRIKLHSATSPRLALSLVHLEQGSYFHNTPQTWPVNVMNRVCSRTGSLLRRKETPLSNSFNCLTKTVTVYFSFSKGGLIDTCHTT